MRKLYVTVLGIALAATKLSAQQPVPLSLQQCMDYALQHNYTIKNARVDVKIQEAQVKQQISAAYPRVNGHAEFDDYIVPQRTYFPTGSFGSTLMPLLTPLYTATGVSAPVTEGGSQYTAIQITPRYSGSIGVSATQPLFDGAVMVALQARNTVVELAKLSGQVTEENVRYNVYKAYHSLTIAYRQFDITVNALQYARSIEHDITVTQQAGLAERIDVERTSVQVNNLATDSIRIANLLATSEQLLKYQIGMDINTPIVLTDTNVEARRNEVLTLLQEEKNYSALPEYNLSQTQLTLNKYNLKRYQVAAYPTLNLIGNAGYNYATEDFGDAFSASKYLSSVMIGLQLNMPIFNGFLRQNQVREAKLNVEKSQNNIEALKLSIDFQTAQARTSLSNAQLQALSQHRNMELATDVLDLAQKKYKAGVGSNLEVTQAQTDQLRAQNNYFSALLDLVNAEADLKKALGQLK